jgi:hypothetical protein
MKLPPSFLLDSNATPTAYEETKELLALSSKGSLSLGLCGAGAPCSPTSHRFETPVWNIFAPSFMNVRSVDRCRSNPNELSRVHPSRFSKHLVDDDHELVRDEPRTSTVAQGVLVSGLGRPVWILYVPVRFPLNFEKQVTFPCRVHHGDTISRTVTADLLSCSTAAPCLLSFESHQARRGTRESKNVERRRRR